MDYLAQLNMVADLSIENMKPNEFAVYMRMLFFNNTLHWKEWFSITYERLGRMAGISNKDTIATAINNLEQNGYIEVERLGKRQGNRYRIIPLYCTDFSNNFGLKAVQNPDKSQTKAGQNPDKSRTKPPPLIRREEIRGDSSITTDLLTNPEGDERDSLTPSEEQVKSAFESTFHPLTKLEELDALKAYTGDYGSKAVLRAIEAASRSKKEPGDRLRLSPKYLLPILQHQDEKSISPQAQFSTVVKNPDMSWIPNYTQKYTRDEVRDMMRKAGMRVMSDDKA